MSHLIFIKAEDAKKAAEKSFEDCNEVARREVSEFDLFN